MNQNRKTLAGKILSTGLGVMLVLSFLLPLVTQPVSAFSGKKGSTYVVTDGGRITYGSGEGGYSNSRKTDLGDDLGTRYSYCVQPAKASPATGRVTVDKVITDDNDTGKWNALRNVVYYSPSYPGYDKNVKDIKGSYYTGTFTKDWAIAHLALSYIYAGRPSDMATWGGTHASDLGDIWTKAKKLGNALWKADSSKDDAVPDSFKVFVSYMSGVQDMIVGYMESPGKAAMKKAGNNASVTKGNGCYSLEGAEYTVYDSANKAVGKLTVKANGESNTIELPEGKYTAKETKAPKGYALDRAVHKLDVESEKTTTFTAKEEPIMDVIKLLLTKKPADYDHDHGEGDATLAGAVYEFRYYDGQYDSVDAAEKSGKATRTWYFVTDAKGAINGQNPKMDEKNKSDALYKNSDGKTAYPLGTYVIREIAPSTGYLLSKDVHVVHIKEDGKDQETVNTYDEKTADSETIIRGGVKLAKIDNDLSEAYAQGDATLEGAEFTIYNRSAETVKVGGKEIPKGDPVLVIKTNDQGIAESAADALPYGTYSVKETKPSNGYTLNTEWEKTFEIRENGKIIDLTSDQVREAVERGGVQIIKRDKEIQKSEALGAAKLDNIVFTIRNESGHDVVVRKDFTSSDKVNWKELKDKKDLLDAGNIKRVATGQDVGTIVTHWNEEKKAYTAETLADDLPYGIYTVRESKTNDSYQRTDKTEHRFTIREDGTLYSYDDNKSDFDLTFDDYVYRSDVQGTKIGDGDSKRFSYVPFKITSMTNGETHVVVTDKNGYFSTKDNRSGDSLEEDEAADTARKQNPFDDLLTKDNIKTADLEKRGAEIRSGVWFGTGEFKTLAAMNGNYGALPYDTYTIEEMACETNKGYTLQKFQFTVNEKSQNGKIDLETITDDIPEIGTEASVDGKNADVKPNSKITLTDTISYTGLTKGKTYTAKGTLMDKATGEAVKDAKGNAITAEKQFTVRASSGKVKVTFTFDGSCMFGKETVVFEKVYDAEGHLAASHEDIEDEGQTVTWEKRKPSYEMYKIRTTKAPSKGNKYGFFANDTVEYEVHVENTGNVTLTMDVTDCFTQHPEYFTAPKLKDAKFTADGTWNNKGKSSATANITIAPGEKATVTFTAKVTDAAKEYLAAAAKDSDSLDKQGHDTNMVYQANKPDDKDGYVNTASCENVTYPNPEKPDEPGKLEPKKDIAQTPVQKPEIGTTLTGKDGSKTVAASRETTLVDTVKYSGLDTTKWYVITGKLIVKDSGETLVENGKPVIVTSEPFQPAASSGTRKITFVIDTTGLERKDLVAFETCCRLDDYKKGDSVDKAKKTVVAEHKDLTDKGQTVTVTTKPGQPSNPKDTPKTPGKDIPKTGDTSKIALFAAIAAAAAATLGVILRKRHHRVHGAEKENE